MCGWRMRPCTSAGRRRASRYLSIDKIVAACKADRRRGGASGLRLPLREPGVRRRRSKDNGIVFVGPPAKAIEAMGDKITSKKLAAAAGVSTVPGHMGLIADADEAVKIAQADRLSGDDQGLGRRRRQGHAHRLERRRGARGVRALEVRGGELVRRRPHLHREVRHRAAPHRDPGARRPARQRALSRRARVLDPAAQPEGDRGGAVAVPRCRDAQGDGRAGGRARPRRWATSPPARSSSSSTASATSTSSR